MPAPPALTVLLCSDTFAHVWARLAGSAGADARVGSSAEGLEGVESSCGVLVAAAGQEAEALAVVRALGSRRAPEVAVVGTETDYRVATTLLRAGADEYFALPEGLGALRGWIGERAARARGAAPPPAAPAPREQYDFGRLLGGSPPLRAALGRAARVIPRGCATVLLTGETGTGKDLLARAIHHNGPRRDHPFVEINCNALPVHLLEAELFGYERGAFTDARAAKPGLFEAADQGTLFLDEIGDLSPELQGKLLRVLETRRVRRLGALREQAVDVRIIAATHVGLAERVREGRFRADLYYRLSVVPIHLPPLRERGDDVLLLAEHFLRRLGDEYGVPAARFTPAARRALLAHSWPGNVRELRNAVERALVLGDGAVRPADLFGEEAAGPPPALAPLPFPSTMEEIERAAARATLERCGGNKTQAAEVLQISRKRLYVLLSGEEGEGAPAE